MRYALSTGLPAAPPGSAAAWHAGKRADTAYPPRSTALARRSELIKRGIALISLCLLVNSSAQGQGFSANEELWTPGDFDGDGNRDVAVVNRESGLIRLGRGQPDGNLVWAGPFASDLPGVSSIAGGRFDRAGQDSLVIVSLTANRAVRWAWNAGNPPAPDTLPIAVQGLGPELAAAGASAIGVTNHPQLAVISTLNSSPATDRLHLLRYQGSSFQTEVEESFGALAHFLGRADLGTGTGTRNFVLREISGLLRLEAYDFAGTNRSVIVQTNLPGMTSHARAIPLSVGPGIADLLVFEAGRSNVLWLRLTVTATNTSLGNLVDMAVAGPLAEVLPITSGPAWRIAVRTEDGRRLSVYDFSLSNGPHLTLQSSLDASGRDALLGVLPGAGGELLVLAGDAGGPGIQRSIRYATNGTGYVEVSRQGLPPSTPWTLGPNVLLLSAPPFTSEDALPIARLRVGDWSKSLVLGVPPGGGTVVAESFSNATVGLSTPFSQTIPVPGGVNGGLVNQYRPNVSILSWEAANSDPLPAVRPTPLSGTYAPGLTVQLATSPATTPEPGQIFYRANAGAWLAFNSGSGVGQLSQTTSLDLYWRRNRDGARGPIYQAAYTIRSDETTPDCDHDGVPDFVEVLYGLDPCASGPDGDRDGASDLAELLNHTNPTDATNRPPATGAVNARLDRVIQIALAPHSHSGGDGLPLQLLPSLAKDTNTPPTTRSTKLWLFDPLGETAAGTSPAPLDANANTVPFAETRALPLPSETFPAALFSGSDASFSSGLLIGTAEDHFDLQLGGGSIATNRGRGLLGFVLPPADPPTRFEFHRGTNSDAVEASRWLAEALAFYQTRQSPTQVVRLDYLATLEVLVVEHTVGQLLYQRGSISTPRLTMTSFRAGEPLTLGPQPLPWSFVPFRTELLAALETRQGDGHPAYSFTAIRDSIHTNLLDLGSSSAQALRDLAAEFYRIAALPPTPSATIPAEPIDALRSFLADGTNHQSYLTSTNWRLTVAQMDAGRIAARNLTDQVPALLEDTWMVRLNALLDDRCVPWTVEGGGQTLTLVDRRGRPYVFQFGFALPLGTLLRVRGYLYNGPAPECAGLAVRPTQFELLEVPSLPPNDLNGNGVADDVERYYFGSLISNRNSDRDHDGVPDLVEILLGTDPNDGSMDCSTNKLVQCGTAWSFDPPAVTGGCCTNLTYTLISSNVLLEIFGLSTRAGGWLISDCCSNYLTCTQLVTIVHTQPPVLTCAGNKNVQLGNAWDFDPPTASAACCASNVTISVFGTVTNGASPPVITRTWLASDCYGNSVSCNQTVTVLSNCGPACVSSATNVVAWWRAEGSALDSVGGHHGTLEGGASFAVGKVGQAFSFAGTDGSYVSVPDSTAWDFGLTNFTIEFWVKFNEIKRSMFIHQQSGASAGGFEFDYQPGGVGVVFARNPSQGFSRGWSPSPVADIWYHLAVTRQGGIFQLYVNGAPMGAEEFDPNPVSNVTGPLRIGSYSGESGYGVNGLIDELSIYSRALSPDELQAIVNALRLSVALVNGNLHMRAEGLPGRQYRIEFSTDLNAWQPVFTSSATGGVITYDVPLANLGTRGFYRAVWLP